MARSFVLGVMAFVSIAGGAAAGTAPGPAHAQAVMPMGRSIGSPTEGHLVNGARLPDAPYLRVLPTYAQDNARFALGALVGLIDRAARQVRHLFPGAVLNIGHLSKQGGGEIERHASHESGRDADLPFYVHDAHGRQLFAEHMVAFRGDGTATSWPGAQFDDARNWSLVAALLNDGSSHVSHIFVSAPLRQRLLTYAAHIGVPEELRTRAAFTMVQPHGVLPHDDHFHVRISCPSGMTGCIENPAMRARRSHGRNHGHAQHHEAHPAQHPMDHEHAPEPAVTPDPAHLPEPATDDG